MTEPKAPERDSPEVAGDLTGKTVGRFAVRARLGAGGMGEVYRADDTKLKRTVALKRMAPHLRDDERFRRHFLKEAERASALNYQHIAGIYDVFEDGGEIFLVMEYVEGQPLRERLGQPLPLAEFMPIALQCADALGTAHEKGIVHRDIKPENIMLTTSGQVKVLDFGIAHLLPQPDAPTVSTSGTVGSFSGTVPYMSPEELLQKPSDGRSDIFSLGIIYYEALTGQHPFRGPSMMATADRILHEEPARLGPTLPPAFDSVIRRMLAKDPSHRYASARELAEDLRAFSEGRELQRPTTAPRVRRVRRVLAGAVAALLLLGLFAILSVPRWRPRWLPGAAAPQIESLAVLPLENISGRPDQDYFSDGMTDVLITNLSQIGAVRVISRTSAMRYKGTTKPLKQIAAELDVEGVVVGSVLRVEDRVRISVELIDARTDRTLWANNYERSVSDVLSLQSEVARAIAQSIHVKLTSQEEARLARARPVNPEAYEAYLKGRYYWDKRGESLKDAQRYFELAIEKDPTYAPAYAGLADTYALSPTYRFLSPNQAMPKAIAAARQALELDDSLAEAHASLAHIDFTYLEPADAEAEFKRALELNPGYATARHWYAIYLSALGRHPEALEQIKQAQTLDPLSRIISANVGWCYYLARQYDQAIAQARKTLELDPSFAVAHGYLGQAYLEKGLFTQALAELRTAATLSGESPAYLAELANAYGVAGQREMALKVLGDLNKLAQRRYVSPYDFALVYAGLGDKEKALDWLEKAYEERDDRLPNLQVHPRLDSLRSEPRFRRLVDRLGLPGAPARD
ncbi:MAG: protein kinase domain-containing protein [Candidatus Acidiferrales bacterium]